MTLDFTVVFFQTEKHFIVRKGAINFLTTTFPLRAHLFTFNLFPGVIDKSVSICDGERNQQNSHCRDTLFQENNTEALNFEKTLPRMTEQVQIL